MRSTAGYIVAAAIAGLFAQPAMAHQVYILGAGSGATCGAWLADRQRGDYLDRGNWALGYISGVAAWSPESDPLNPLNGLDTNAVFYWLDNYCQQNPLVPLPAALDAFIKQHPG